MQHISNLTIINNVSHHFATVPSVGTIMKKPMMFALWTRWSSELSPLTLLHGQVALTPGPTWQMFVWRSDAVGGLGKLKLNEFHRKAHHLPVFLGKSSPNKNLYILGNWRLLNYCNNHLDFWRDKGFYKGLGFISTWPLRIRKTTPIASWVWPVGASRENLVDLLVRYNGSRNWAKWNLLNAYQQKQNSSE